MQVSGTSYVHLSPLTRYQTRTNADQDNAVKPATPVGNIHELNPEQLRQLQILKARDREVKNHEQAHLNAAGDIAISGASFQYVTGPDGQRYAVGGEVSIDTSAVANDPAATLRKAEIIRRAALAPAQPSSQDYRVAAQATAMANKASVELMKSRQNPHSSGSLLHITA